MTLYEHWFTLEGVESTWKVLVRDRRDRSAPIQVEVIRRGNPNFSVTLGSAKAFYNFALSTACGGLTPAGRADAMAELCRIFVDA